MELTNDNCTAPQKQVAVASSSVDQPSLADPARGKKGLEVSAVCCHCCRVCLICWCWRWCCEYWDCDENVEVWKLDEMF